MNANLNEDDYWGYTTMSSWMVDIKIGESGPVSVVSP